MLETRSGLDCTMWTIEHLEEKRSFLDFYFDARILIMNRSDDKNLYLVLLKNLLSDSGFLAFKNLTANHKMGWGVFIWFVTLRIEF